MLQAVRSGSFIIPSLQAQLNTSGVTGTLFSITGVCWDFQCDYAPQYPQNSDPEAWQLTPKVFFSFLGLRPNICSPQKTRPTLIGIFTACLRYLQDFDFPRYSTIKQLSFILAWSLFWSLLELSPPCSVCMLPLAYVSWLAFSRLVWRLMLTWPTINIYIHGCVHFVLYLLSPSVLWHSQHCLHWYWVDLECPLMHGLVILSLPRSVFSPPQYCHSLPYSYLLSST